MRKAKSILVRKPEGRGPLGRFRNRWKDNIKFILSKYVKG
jgi:hypothetical protein